MFIFPVCELILTEIKLILTDNHCFYHHLCCHVAPMRILFQLAVPVSLHQVSSQTNYHFPVKLSCVGFNMPL